MKKTLIACVAAMAASLTATAATPVTLSGKWQSAPIDHQARPSQSQTVMTLDFGSDEAASGTLDFTAVYALKGCQMGSKTMKVNVPVTVTGKAAWQLTDGELKLTFDPATLSAKADNDRLELDVPEVMKAAMQARASEFAAGITGSLEDALREDLATNGFPMQQLDIADDQPGTLTASANPGLSLTFTRQ